MPALQADTRVSHVPARRGAAGLAWQLRRAGRGRGPLGRPAVPRAERPRGPTVCAPRVAFPVLRGDTLLGVCELFSREQRPVPPELVDVLASAGRQIGQFLARLRAESELREVAHILQRSLLPSPPARVPGLQLAARYRAGAEGVFVGGDTYDVLPLPDGRFMVLIADVCGTGAEAAAMTALTRHTARAAASVPGGACRRRARRGQHRAAPRAQRAAAVRHRLLPDPRVRRRPAHRVTVSVAGHPLPLLRERLRAVVEVGRPGHAARRRSRAPRSPRPRSTCRRARTLVLYTDGVTEARNDGGTQFGDDGLAGVLRAPCRRCGSARSPRSRPPSRTIARTPGTRPTTSPSSRSPFPAVSGSSAGLTGHGVRRPDRLGLR